MSDALPATSINPVTVTSSSGRRRWVLGNWKMAPLPAQVMPLLQSLAPATMPQAGQQQASHADLQIGVAVPALYLSTVRTALPAGWLLMAQDVSTFADTGAYTGDISAQMLAGAGVEAVLVGHSERRQYAGETDRQLQQKLEQVLAAGLTAVFCVGETANQREAGAAEQTVLGQLAVLSDFLAQEQADIARLLVAYEPVWAIGTGKTASVADAEAMHQAIRGWLAARGAGQVSILYGGSVKPDNAPALAVSPWIDGVLVGGASLQADDFNGIIRAFAL